MSTLMGTFLHFGVSYSSMVNGKDIKRGQFLVYIWHTLLPFPDVCRLVIYIIIMTPYYTCIIDPAGGRVGIRKS